MRTGNASMELWLTDEFRGVVSRSMRVRSTIYSGRGSHSQVAVVDTEGLGRVLLRDGVVVLAEKDEGAAQEMLVHPPLFVHPEPRKILIVGGGHGATAREALKHPGVTQIDVVERDALLVEASQKFMPFLGNPFADSRVRLHLGDAAAFLGTEKWDVIILETLDEGGGDSAIFSGIFYDRLKSSLTEKGILVGRAESPLFDLDSQRSVLGLLRPRFDRLHLYFHPAWIGAGGSQAVLYASPSVCPLLDFNKERVRKANLNCRYYNAGVHTAAFAVPEFVRRELRDTLSPFPVNE